jgi:uncharacterized protein (DUF302 family)
VVENNFGFGKEVSTDFDTSIDNVIDALATEGFGVLSDINVAATLKKKLDKDMPPYRILGACNPVLAHQAITAVPEIGLLLPCNVLVRQDESGAVHVSFMDPAAVMGLVENDDVLPLAAAVREKLDRVMSAL